MKKPVSQTLFPWLKANLGKNCLAPLTGTDYSALAAAVHTIDLYAETRDPSVLEAFAIIVLCMQSSTQELAYHAIAHVMDWSDRSQIWTTAGLSTPIHLRQCLFEPAARS